VNPRELVLPGQPANPRIDPGVEPVKVA
jgi:hypothetical protein